MDQSNTIAENQGAECDTLRKEIECSDNSMIEDQRAEYESLRNEIEYSDSTCVRLIYFLFLITAPTVAFIIKPANIQNEPYKPFLALTLSIIWYFGFWYLSEKRFVIKRAGIFIHLFFEIGKSRFGWERYQHRLRKENIHRPVFWSPYYLETAVCAVVIFSIPLLLELKILYSTIRIKQLLLWCIGFFATTGLALLFLFDGMKSYRSYKMYNLESIAELFGLEIPESPDHRSQSSKVSRSV